MLKLSRQIEVGYWNKVVALVKVLLVSTFFLCSGCAVYFPNNLIDIDTNHIDKQTCKPISSPNLYGPEDITINSGVAYISSDNRREDDVNGGIYRYNFNNDDLKRMTLKFQKGFSKKSDFFKEIFHPHGISLYENPEGEKWLFVINHRKICCKKHSYVEIFKIQGDELIHRESIPDSESVNKLNDLVAISEDQYYATNNGGALNQITGAFLRWGRDEVVFYDGTRYHKILDDIAFANGINYNPEKNLLIISSSLGGKVRIYQVNKTGDSLPELNLLDQAEFGTLLDNLEWKDDQKTILLVGAHPSPIKFTFHVISDKLVKYAPSQVLQFSIKNNSVKHVEEVYFDEGAKVSASSVAVINGNKLMIGNVFSSQIQICDSKH